MSYPLLKKAPKDHMSDDFIKFLKQNNKVKFENDQWLVIENCKYHTKKSPWLTAFHKGKGEWYNDLDILWYHCEEWRDWKWIKKSKLKQSVKRFHIHIVKDNNELPE